MAAGHLAKLCTCILSLLPVIYTLSPCTEDNFGEFITACDPETQQKKIVYYVNKNCDLDSNKSAPLPKPIENLPCFCQPGHGLQSKNSTKCTPCAKGYYSHGGELIDDWSDWNTTKSKGVPGLAYGVDTYCSDFLSGKTCSAWRPSADFSYLLSGEFKNSTQLRCFEQSMLVISRMFLLPGQQNKISFEYKVDGASCRKGSRSCSQGLHFYVNEELKLKSDTQFSWKKLEVSLKPGATRLKFVYHKSCTREAILDVAYIRHLSMVGTDSGQGLTAKAVKCTACNSGSYADTEGSTECTKCVQNEFQPKQGQEKCEKCGVDQFSRIGETKCYDLPDCQKKDYFIKPKPIETCVKNGSTDVYVREQVRGLPSWPVRPCKPDKSMQVKQPKVQCRCLAGFAMTTGGKKINCEKCEVGKYSDGFMKECKTCPAGHAAIPGFFLDSFTEDRIPGVIKQNCSGALCQAKDNQYWIPRGDYMATRRIAGNFEVTLDFQDIEVDYHDAKVTFNCSIDCRISADGKRLAKHDHCFLRFVIQKWNETSQSYRSILEQDCVSKYRQKLRDGTMMNHVYPVPDPGRYSFRSLFHHEDEGNYSLLSYEARVYHFDVTGAKQGSAQKCVKCPAGEYLTKTGAFCLKCPEGKYSKEGSVECLDCPDNSFSDKEGSGGCTKCGAGTTSNHNKTGCDYNKCQFKYGEHVYDLSPLRVVDGPMYKVRTYRPKSKYFFPLYYYVNVCSLKHDNSSCATMKRVEDKKRKGTTVRKQVLIKTMACKRWSFDENHSYSIGEVMNFLPWKGNETNGLLLNLTGGYRCWNKGNKAYQTPYTTILMKCEPDIDIGYPEPLNNGTAVERNCVFELQWRTRYACRLCHPVNDYNQIVGRCQKGQQRVTYVRKTNCRSVSTTKKVFMKTQLCTENEKNTLTATAKEDDDTPLIVAIVIAVLVIVILIVFVIYYARRNRYLRGRLFVPGKSFSKVQEEDEDELVDNMG